MTHEESGKEAQRHYDASQVYDPYAGILSHLKPRVLYSPEFLEFDSANLRFPGFGIPFQEPLLKFRLAGLSKFDKGGRIVHRFRISEELAGFVDPECWTEVYDHAREIGSLNDKG